MFYLNIKGLVASLIQRQASSWNGLNYLFALMAYDSVSGLLSVFTGGSSKPEGLAKTLSAFLASAIVCAIGIFILRAVLIMFYRAFDGDTHPDFVPALLAIFWVNSMRTAIVLWPSLLIGWAMGYAVSDEWSIWPVGLVAIVVGLGSLWYMIVKTKDALREVHFGRKAALASATVSELQ